MSGQSSIKLGQNSKVKVTRGTTARVTHGTTIPLIWHWDDMAISYRVMAYTWANYVVISVSFEDELYGATWHPSNGWYVKKFYDSTKVELMTSPLAQRPHTSALPIHHAYVSC
jgi:hypothetical protein